MGHEELRAKPDVGAWNWRLMSLAVLAFAGAADPAAQESPATSAVALSAFTDRACRPLGERPRARAVDLQTYLTRVVFIDGSRKTPCVTGVFALPAEAQTSQLPLRVVVYDYAGITAETLERAQRAVARVFEEIDVDVSWMDVAKFTQAMPDEPSERRVFVNSVLQINLISPAMHKALGIRQNALGSASPGSRYGWISIEQLRQSARLARVDVGDALGYVIAHEIGHLLSDSHSAKGLMRADIDSELIAHNRVSFLAEEAARIRKTLADRTNGLVPGHPR